jgi:calcium-dependent protein kinase
MGMCASSERPESNSNRNNQPVMKPGKNTWFPESVPTLKTASREDINSLYNVGRMLGKFGQVRMATLKCNPSLQYAIKTVNIDEIKDELFRLETELNVLKKMDHCNIIKFYETYTDGKRFHIVMELCNGGELFDVLMAKEKFTETETLALMHQILSTIA